MKAARVTREAAEDALIGPRVAVRFAEWALEEVIRRIAADAHAADGNLRRGPAFDRLFPDGVSPVITPRSVAQVVSATLLKVRLDATAAGSPGRDRGESLSAAIAKLQGAIEARKGAGQAVAVARAVEDAAREDWLAHYSKDAGAVRVLFPTDRDRQDLYFDELDTSRSGGSDEPPGEG